MVATAAIPCASVDESHDSDKPRHQHHQHNSPASLPASAGPRDSPNANNVRVVVRIRPLAEYEKGNGSTTVVRALVPSSEAGSNGGGSSSNDIVVVDPPGGGGDDPSVQDTRWFQLDAVLDGSATQRQVYRASGAHSAVTRDLFEGCNCTIVAYGQTGAGKTYSMGTATATGDGDDAPATGDGDAADDGGAAATSLSDDAGIIPRACADLFDSIRVKCRDDARVEMSYLEVYNEEIRDLLSADPAAGAAQLRIREQLNGEVYVRGLTSLPVAGPAAVGRLMGEAARRRVTGSTNMNAASSRSHAICVLRLQGTLSEGTVTDGNHCVSSGGTKFQAKLTLVDLAGSERIKKTGAEGDRAQEGISINKGLFVLGQVISALSERRPGQKRRPPYRDSKLTRLLQDSLGGNSRTIMIACVSPADYNVEESINTLRYATSARNIKNTVSRNVTQILSPEEAAKLKRENELLKQEVRDLQQTIERMAVEYEARDVSLLVNDQATKKAAEECMDSIKSESSEMTQTVLSLENEIHALRQALDKAKRELKESTAANAIELPALKVKVALLEDEIHESRAAEMEVEHLRHDYEDLQTEASAARAAAKRLSHIVHEMSQRSISASKDDGVYDLDDESSSSSESVSLNDDNVKMEYERTKANEAWVGFLVRIYSLFKEDMRILGDCFDEVKRIASSNDSDTFSVGACHREAWWKRLKNESKEEEMELRLKAMNEYITSYMERFLEIEDRLDSRFDFLIGIEDSVQKDREQLERKVVVHDSGKSTGNDHSDVLLKWLKVTLGITAVASNEETNSDESRSENQSMAEPFSFFNESATSVKYDDSFSVADGFMAQSAFETVGESDEDSGSSQSGHEHLLV